MKKFSFFKTFLFPILTILFIIVSVNIFRIKIGYYIEKTKKETKRLRIENDYLAKKIAYERSPKKLEEYAKTMNLNYPEPHSIVILEEIKTQKVQKINWLASFFLKKSKTDI